MSFLDRKTVRSKDGSVVITLRRRRSKPPHFDDLPLTEKVKADFIYLRNLVKWRLGI